MIEKTQRSSLFLDSMRNSGDPIADTVIAKMLANGGIAEANAALGHLIRNMDGLLSSAPPILSDFIEQCGTLPTWADRQKIQRAQVLFTSQGPAFGLALMAESLPILYAGGKGGAQVLFSTGKLSGNFRRRASQTLRFILDVMEPGGLEPTGKGIRAIQKVRLMHAAIRHYAKNSPIWVGKTELWGSPINQEELAGTLLAFSSVALGALKKMEINISDEDQESYLHTWKAVGHILGIEAGMLPNDISDANELWKQIEARNFIPSPEGQTLAVDHLTFLKELIPGKELDGFANSLMNFLMGKKIARTILKLPRPGWTYYLINIVSWIFRLESRLVLSSSTLREMSSKAGLLLMDSLYRNWNSGDGTPFKIPASLRGSDT
jgi:hypothetical protein